MYQRNLFLFVALLCLGSVMATAQAEGQAKTAVCVACHGADGNGGVVGKDVKNSPIQDFIENTRQGFGGSNYGSRLLYMPARPASDISDAEIQLVFDYVQTL